MITRNEMGKHTIDFESAADVLAYIATNERTGAHSHGRMDDSFCRYSWDETKTALINGWPEGSKEIDIKTDAISALVDDSGFTIQYDVTGNYIDIGAYLSGQPECFGTMEASEAPKKNVKICVSITASWNVDADRIQNRGAAILALIDKLTMTHTIDLVFFSHVKSLGSGINEWTSFYQVDMKEGYSRDLIAFYAAHPGMLRRIEFAVDEQYCEKNNLGGYGSISEPKGIKERFDIYFPSMARGTDEVYKTIETSRDEVNRIIAEVAARDSDQ